MPVETLEALEIETQPAAPPPQAVILQLLFGKHLAYCVSTVARLGVVDHMGEGGATVAELAAAVGAAEMPLFRVMRTLAGVGVFASAKDGKFRLTPVSRLLRSDAPASMRHTAMQMGDVWSTRPWEYFTQTVRTGQDGVTQAFGKNLFEYLAEHEDQAENFNRSMTGYSAAMSDAIVGAYDDFESVNRLADVGGGHGHLMATILRRYPHMQGIVFDLPEVVAGAQQDGSAGRMQFEGGSFFERVPSGCDAYIMKFILHDWSDEHCVRILRSIRKEMPADGRVLVVEQLITDGPESTFARLLDMEMLALTVGGRERTASEFEALFEKAGLRLHRIVRTESPVCIIEARPALGD